MLRIDHTAVAVRNLDEALARYERLYNVLAADRALVESQRVEVAFLRLGDTQLELISPTDETTGVARFLKKQGEGLHHVGVLVANIEAELKRLAGEGIELIDHAPRRGLHGRIAFVHPRGTGGVLLELVEVSSS